MKMQTVTNYKQWIKEITKKYKQNQIKAAIQVNKEMLEFYFQLGKDINEKSFKSFYGSEFYEKLSKDLTSELINVQGLSPRNLRYMETFYLLYKDEIKNATTCGKI